MRKLYVGLLAIVFGLSVVPRADAALILAGDIQGLLFCASDNNIGCSNGTVLTDTDPALGVLALGVTSIAGVTVNGSVHTVVVGPPTNLLDSTSLSIINTNPTPITARLSVSATDFVGPVSEASATASGTWGNGSQGSSVLLTWWNDNTNQQGAETTFDRPGLLVDTFSDTANAQIDSFSHNGGPFAVSDTGAFSMTLGLDMTLLGNDSLISRGQSEIKDVAAVAEPTTMLLLGAGLLGGGAKLRKRKV